MDKQEQIFADFLESKSLKFTNARKIILDVVFKNHQHFHAEQLYNLIRKDYDNISVATVYRTIPLLIEANLIQMSHRRNGKDYFEHIYGHENHLHLICENCGKIIEEDSQNIEDELKQLAKKHNFKITTIRVNAKGICAECKAKKN
ncbi:MAG: transcriptional repressor [Candidatus Cloacimonadota bacterium]|nr:transcriptional repressor [Candidatus Cloacimonadota bacterium]